MTQLQSLKTQNKFKKTEIGEIPVDWEMSQVRSACQSIQYGYTASATSEPLGPKLLRITDIQEGRVDWKNVSYCKCPAEIQSDYLLKPGDILFARTGATTGKSFIIQECPKAVFASYLIRIVTKEAVDPIFFFYVFNSSIYWRQINQQMGGSAQGGVNASSLGEIRVPIPPTAEQTKIAEILSSVDRAIEKIAEVIEKTKHLKKALMHELLTRGIGHTKLKKSNVGQVPAEWDIKQLHEVAIIERGKFQHRPRNEPRFYGGKYPFVQTGDVTNSNGRIRTYSQTLNEEGLSISRIFPKGTILITIAANIGETAIAEFDVAFPDSLVGIITKEEIDNRFLEYYLRTRKEHFNSVATQSAQKNINLETLRPYPVPIPPKPEQIKIAEILSSVDEELEKETAQKTTLENLKKGLMQVLLTGKIRVK